MDGGATWTLDDSTVNVDSNGNLLPIDQPAAQPRISSAPRIQGRRRSQADADGQVIIYAAMSGPNGGIWRSEDTGKTWPIDAAPARRPTWSLDPDSGTIINPDTARPSPGNLQIVYAGISGVGVYMSPNQGQVWTLMTGGVGNPADHRSDTSPATNVNPIAGPTPNGAEGRIVLAVPDATGNAAEDAVYEGWLYAAVAATDGSFDGLFMTKDFGENWTQVRIPTVPPSARSSSGHSHQRRQPSPIIAITGGGEFAPEGNYDITLAVDPTNPNIVYLGGDAAPAARPGLIRVDTTNIWDAHSLVAYANFANDGGGSNLTATGPTGRTASDSTPEPLHAPGGTHR